MLVLPRGMTWCRGTELRSVWLRILNQSLQFSGEMDSQKNDETVLTKTHAGGVGGRGVGTEWDGGSLGSLMQNAEKKPARWGGGGSGGQQGGVSGGWEPLLDLPGLSASSSGGEGASVSTLGQWKTN